MRNRIPDISETMMIEDFYRWSQDGGLRLGYPPEGTRHFGTTMPGGGRLDHCRRMSLGLHRSCKARTPSTKEGHETTVGQALGQKAQ